ncbi:MAG: DUF4440 domain-containing protein [Gemmatimonadetes bacterium]|nr:DUF4440 domain-containing protein [Gemmatimonadota bacterium]
MTRLLVAVCSVCVAACRPGPPGDGADRQELGNRVAQYYRDMSARRWTSYRDHFWPRATLTTVWQPPGEGTPRVVITSIDEFLANTAAGPDSKPTFEERLLSHDIRLAGNLAHVWASYEARFGDSASVAAWRGYDAFTWMKHGGEWRIVALAYTDQPGEKRGAP